MQTEPAAASVASTLQGFGWRFKSDLKSDFCCFVLFSSAQREVVSSTRLAAIPPAFGVRTLPAQATEYTFAYIQVPEDVSGAPAARRLPALISDRWLPEEFQWCRRQKCETAGLGSEVAAMLKATLIRDGGGALPSVVGIVSLQTEPSSLIGLERPSSIWLVVKVVHLTQSSQP